MDYSGQNALFSWNHIRNYRKQGIKTRVRYCKVECTQYLLSSNASGDVVAFSLDLADSVLP